MTVFNGEDDPERDRDPRRLDRGRGRARRPREVPLAPRLARTEDAERRETLLTLDLGARHQPFRAVILDVADPRFFRGVTVEARPDPSPPRPAGTPPLAWRSSASARSTGTGRRTAWWRTCGSTCRARERTIRLRIHNRDDAPLEVRGVSVVVPVERLAFEAAPGRALPAALRRLRAWAPRRTTSPRTVGDAALWTARAARGPAAAARAGRRRAADAASLDGAPSRAAVGGPRRRGGRPGAGDAAGAARGRMTAWPPLVAGATIDGDARACALSSWRRSLAVAVACAPAGPAVIPLRLPSGKVLQSEVMVKDEDRAMGLMFRPSLARRPRDAVRLRAAGLPRHLDEELQVPDRHRLAGRDRARWWTSRPASRRARPIPARSTSRCGRAGYVVEMNAGQAQREKVARGAVAGFKLPR